MIDCGMIIMSLLKWLVWGNFYLCVIWYSNIIVFRVYLWRMLWWRIFVVMVWRFVNGFIWYGRELRFVFWSFVLFYWWGWRICSGNSRFIWYWRELVIFIVFIRGMWRRFDLFGRICNNWWLGLFG